MNTYYLRTIAADYPAMLSIGVALGAIQIGENGSIYAPGGCWDFIGAIHKPTGETIATEFGSQPVLAPMVDAKGNEYIHVNLITPINLNEAAHELAATHPEIAEGLANLPKYFLLDAEGNAIAPAQPYRVFAS